MEKTKDRPVISRYIGEKYDFKRQELAKLYWEQILQVR